MPDKMISATASPLADEVVFRVIIRGLRLDAPTKALLDTAIRSAVIHEIALIDRMGTPRIGTPADDPETRSILRDLGSILGLVMSSD